MTENTLMYHFYTTKRLNDEDIRHLVALCFDCDQSEVHGPVSESKGSSIEMSVFSANKSSSLSLRFYPEQLLYSIDVYVMEPEKELDLSHIRQIETKMRDYLRSINHLVSLHSLFAPIRRGKSLWRYFATADERLYEAKLDQLVAEKDTEYQNVKIYHSPLHGHVLYLDDDVMFGESDQESYTRVLLGLETGKAHRNSYAGKEILILGGGDGGVINELLKQAPKMVVMCEIDDVVVQLCRKYMRSACGDALDTYEGPNKKIIIGDCLQHLHDCIQSGKRYDFIINDLTEFPVNKDERGWVYDFATENSQVMELSLKALKPEGSYLSRGGTEAGEFFWKVFEEDCRKLGCQFRCFKSQVPSFYEEYRLYEVGFS